MWKVVSSQLESQSTQCRLLAAFRKPFLLTNFFELILSLKTSQTDFDLYADFGLPNPQKWGWWFDGCKAEVVKLRGTELAISPRVNPPVHLLPGRHHLIYNLRKDIVFLCSLQGERGMKSIFHEHIVEEGLH
jgi:hypothetical protein